MAEVTAPPLMLIGDQTNQEVAVCGPPPSLPRSRKRRRRVEEEIVDVSCPLVRLHRPLQGLRTIDREDGELKGSRVPRLALVLDLDHTLLHSSACLLSPKEKDLLSHNGDLLALDCLPMVVKLRPSVRSFLKQVSILFNLYIYTLNTSLYAQLAANILDPDGTYFGDRVFSRDHCTKPGRKNLDNVADESLVLIVDDNEKVWGSHKENLIQVERYQYFGSTWRYIVRSLEDCAKEDGDYALEEVLDVLRCAHRMFFDKTSDIESRDIREVLRKMKHDILKGCNIVFSEDVLSEVKPVWMMAEEMGATCCCTETFDVWDIVDDCTTHVVSSSLGTDAARCAMERGKSLVSPLWVQATYYSGRRQDEDNFYLLR